MKECWFCGHKLMEEKREKTHVWYECEGCHATDVPLPNISEKDVTFRGVPWSSWVKGGKVEARRLGLIGRIIRRE